MGWYEEAQQREAAARAAAAAEIAARQIPQQDSWTLPPSPRDLSLEEGMGLPERMGPREVPFDPFAQVTNGPRQAQVEPIGEQSILGPKPAIAETESSIAEWGKKYGDLNRAVEAARRAVAETRDTGVPGGGARQLTYAELMRDLPERTGGGSRSTSVTNAIISPAQGKAFAERLSAATEAQKSAESEKSGIAQAMYRDLAALSREQASGQAAAFAAHESQRLKVQAQIDAQMADNARLIQEIKNTHVDPERMYKGQGGGFLKFRHTIGMALGALGAGLMKQSGNGVADLVNAQLDRDMKGQMADLQNKRWVYQAGRNLITDLYAKTHDLEKSYLLGKMTYTDIAKNMVEAITKNAASEEAVQNGAVAMAQLDKAQIQNELDLKKLEYRRVTQTTTSSPGTLTPAANLAMQAILAQRLQAAGLGGGAAAGKQLPAKYGAGLGALQSSIDQLKEFKTTYLAEKEKPGAPGSYALEATFGGLVGSKVPAIEAKKGIIAAQLRRAVESGVMTEKDFERYEKAMPGLLDHPATARAKLQIVESQLVRDYQGMLQGFAKTGYDVTQFTGEPQQRAASPVLPALKKLGLK